MRTVEDILYEIRVLEGTIYLEKVNNYNNMDWAKYNQLICKKNELKKELHDLSED